MRGRPTLRDRLVKRLQEAGVTVDPHDIYPAKGHWRTSPYADVFRWEAKGRVKPEFEVVEQIPGRFEVHLCGSCMHVEESAEAARAWFRDVKDQVVVLGSWETMTACARYGVTVDTDGTVSANEPPK